MTGSQPLDLDSTLVRQGSHAATLSEMVEFVSAIEQRPLGRLLEELPGLASLSDMKFSLARKVIRRRAKNLAEIEREQLRVLADEIADRNEGELANRIRAVFI